MAKKSIQKTAKKAVKKAAKKNPKAFIIAVVAIILIIAIAIAVFYFAFPEKWDALMASLFADNPPLVTGEGDLQIHFINVGQGDCILILFPDGKDMVIDCGNKSSGYNYSTTQAYLSTYITDGQIDYLMLTHGDEDHVEYLDNIIEEYDVDNIFMPNVLAAPTNAQWKEKIDTLDTSMFTDPDTIETQMYAEFFYAALTEEGCNVKLNVDPDKNTNSIVIEEETYRLTFYCPTQEYYDNTKLNTAERKNAISPIGILEYNGRKIVLTGDSNEINEPDFIERINATTLDCDVLKVGHHGSETSTTNAFLNAIKCEYAVISCNYLGNTFYHPRQTTLDRLKSKDYTVYRTDLNGNVVCTVDKDGNIKFTVETEVSQEEEFDGLTDAEIAEIKKAA